MQVEPTQSQWRYLALAEMALVALCLAYWSFQTPFPYGDGLRTFDYAVRNSWSDVWMALFSGTEEFRPLYFAAVKLVHDLSGGPSMLPFRAIQTGFVVLDLALLYLLFSPRSASAWFGFTLAVTCFAGLHTTTDNLTASTPLPFGPVVFALVLGTLLLLRGRPSLRLDIVAGVMSLAGVFLIEYGVVVGLMWVVAGLSHMGPARRSTATWAIGGLGVYAAIRLLTNAQPVPGPFYSDTGYLFGTLSLSEQVTLFGERAWVFHLYNVLSTILTVLLSEPRAGIYRALDTLVNDAPVKSWQIIHWASSLLATTLVIVWATTWSRLGDEARRTLILGTVVILVNSMLGYMYTRDRIPTVAGMSYAVLVGLAASAAWEHRSKLAAGAHRSVLTVLLVAIGLSWASRATGTILIGRDQAWMARDEWTEANQAGRAADPDWDELTEALRLDLQRRALSRTLQDPRGDPDWMFEWFERKRF